MRKFLPVFLSLLLFISVSASVLAVNTLRHSFGTKVSASVGEYLLNISGFVSPYASVVLTSNGVFIRATVADAKGNFYFTDVLINKGFSGFCLEAVDFKRIGDSYTCISVPPATGSITKKNLFLPPTLGLSTNSVAAGGEVLAFGYTMPNALVTLNLGNGKTMTVLADGTGYYIFKLKNIPAGKYQLYATAKYNNLDSLSPSRKVDLRSLSLWERIIEFLKNLLAKIGDFLTSVSLGPLWLGLPVLILIIILILKLWPDKFTSIYESRLIIFFSKKEKKHLHHYWLFGE